MENPINTEALHPSVEHALTLLRPNPKLKLLEDQRPWEIANEFSDMGAFLCNSGAAGQDVVVALRHLFDAKNVIIASIVLVDDLNNER